MSITSRAFGVCDGVQINEYVMTNKNGMEVRVFDRGGIIRSIVVKDKDGKRTDVALAHNTPADYIINDGYLGAAIGRFANRLEKSQFEINGQKFSVTPNEGENSLHGGAVGFDKKTWDVEALEAEEEPSLRLYLTSADGEEGYPGELKVVMTYTLTRDNSLVINYCAESDKDTVVNLTNHTYFNLAGHDSGKIDNQILKLNADFFTPNTTENMPYGEILSVEGTPFDFREGKTFGEGFAGDHEQVKMCGGFDHNFIINGRGMRCHATVYNPDNGICMECLSDKPALQLYTANALKADSGKDGAKYDVHSAFCLETQYYPNSMKYSHFPSPILRAGEEYNFTTTYKFYIK